MKFVNGWHDTGLVIYPKVKKAETAFLTIRKGSANPNLGNASLWGRWCQVQDMVRPKFNWRHEATPVHLPRSTNKT
jgi:hypothetical protein